MRAVVVFALDVTFVMLLLAIAVEAERAIDSPGKACRMTFETIAEWDVLADVCRDRAVRSAMAARERQRRAEQ